MIAYVFPGQGAQHRGMGGALFDELPAVTAKADAVLGYSIKTLCLEDPHDQLKTTAYTQPALYVVNALTWMKTLIDRVPPDFVAGHSLGEYNALLAAGVFSFEVGLRLVQKRAELMQRAPEGAMMAVLGIGAERVEAVLHDCGAAEVELANDNAPEQTVLSGPAAALEALIERLTQAGAARCRMLNVGGAFHSRSMAGAARELAAVLSEVPLGVPRVPVIANVTGEPYCADSVLELLGRQMRMAVQWRRTMSYLIRHGITEIAELGPGRVLTGLFRANRSAEPETPRPATAPPLVAVTSAPPLARAPRLPASPGPCPELTAASLGSAEFRADYGVRYSYVAGAMYKGIASPALVVRMGKAGLLGFLGSGGLRPRELEESIQEVQRQLRDGQAYGFNLLHHPNDPAIEMETVELFLRYDVRNVEAAAYLKMTEPLVHFRLRGAHRDARGQAAAPRRVIAKVSRPEVARPFLSPPPEDLVRNLVAAGKLTAAEAALARELPVASDLCVEADSGGHTDGGVAYALMPALRGLRDEIMRQHGFASPVRLGAAGGIGAPEAAAAAFLLGADFILTGSVNQCSPEAGTSDVVKGMLQQLDVQDTTYAPAGDLFELGARVQVMKKGVLFAARANKLYELYRNHDSIDDIDPAVRETIERRYLRRSLDEVWEDTRRHYLRSRPEEIAKAERHPKHRMALIFRWYFAHTTRLALQGDTAQIADFQVHCGPAMGAFNRFVRGTDLEDWRRRHVDLIAERLMQGAAEVLRDFYRRQGAEPAAAPSMLPPPAVFAYGGER